MTTFTLRLIKRIIFFDSYSNTVLTGKKQKIENYFKICKQSILFHFKLNNLDIY